MSRPRRSVKPIERLGSAPFTRASARNPAPSRSSRGEQTKRDREDDFESELSGLDESEDDGYDSPPPAKKQRRQSTAATAPAPKQRKGKLSAFSNLPMDTVLDVASYLDPITLLSFSRTNKALHAALSAKSGEGVWKAVREAAAMPPCTTGRMSERELVMLFADKKCMICHSVTGALVDYSNKIRFCKPCQTAKSVVSCLALSISSADNFFSQYPVPTGKTRAKQWAFVPSVNALNARIKEMSGAARRRGGQCEALASFCAERKAYLAAVQEDAEALQAWFNDEASRKYRTGSDLQAERIASIRAKVVELVWKRIKDAVIIDVEKSHVARLAQEEQQRKWAEERQRYAEERAKKAAEQVEARTKKAAEQAALRAKAAARKAELESPQYRAELNSQIEADLAAPASAIAAQYAKFIHGSAAQHRTCGLPPLKADHSFRSDPAEQKKDSSGAALGVWTDGNWVQAVVEALALVQLPANTPGDAALTRLEAQGKMWECKSCADKGKKVEAMLWSDLVKHICKDHRGNAKSSTPPLRLNGPVELRLSGPPVLPAAPAPPPSRPISDYPDAAAAAAPPRPPPQLQQRPAAGAPHPAPPSYAAAGQPLRLSNFTSSSALVSAVGAALQGANGVSGGSGGYGNASVGGGRSVGGGYANANGSASRK
ncbi:hypothetical protein JCM10213_000916 [Rhodosporidiobolus nylandii]